MKELRELGDHLDEKNSVINPTVGKQGKKWFSGPCCLGNRSIGTHQINRGKSPRLGQLNRYKLVK